MAFSALSNSLQLLAVQNLIRTFSSSANRSLFESSFSTQCCCNYIFLLLVTQMTRAKMHLCAPACHFRGQMRSHYRDSGPL